MSENRQQDGSRDDGMLAEKRRMMLLLRTCLTLSIAYLLIFSSDFADLGVPQLLFLAAYLASNLVMAWLPARVLGNSKFEVGLVLIDTGAISLALYLLPHTNTDVFVFYFVVILLASISERLTLSLLAPLLTSVAYVGFLIARHGMEGLMQPEILLRVPFFLLTGAFYGFFVDRVRRSQVAAAMAQQREEARTEFLSLITHDLKQPLWVAQQSAALAYDQLGADETQQRTTMARLIASLRRMESLTMNFLDFSRIQAKDVRVAPQTASLNQVVEDIVELYRPILAVRGLNVRLELDRDLPRARLDPQQFDRALANLLDNAIKFTPEGGEIVCRTSTDGDTLTFIIDDDGPGIPLDRAATLFTRFDEGTNLPDRSSTGLGLYITRAIVLAHGGQIELVNGSKCGARFRIQLPIAQQESRKESVPSEAIGRARLGAGS
jgi:signal transduction histidine kinase